MKQIVRIIALLMCLIIFSGCSMGSSEQGKSADDSGEYVYYVASEEGIKNDGTVLYRMEYGYDENDNEISRTAYGPAGDEDDELLSYAYDKQEILEEYWTIEPSEEMQTGYWKIYKDYDFVYDSKGNLKTWKFYDDNEPGLSQISYTYKAAQIQ